MRRALASLVALMLFALVDAAHADGVISELRIGGLVHDVPGLWSGFSYERRTIDVNIEALLSTSLPVLGGAVRPARARVRAVAARLSAALGTARCCGSSRASCSRSRAWPSAS